MNQTKKTAFILIISSIVLNACCIFKEGSWAPLPSCDNTEKHAQEKEKKENPSSENESDMDKVKED